MWRVQVLARPGQVAAVLVENECDDLPGRIALERHFRGDAIHSETIPGDFAQGELRLRRVRWPAGKGRHGSP
jgi:hypothetical protein